MVKSTAALEVFQSEGSMPIHHYLALVALVALGQQRVPALRAFAR
jgi:hypothetical protein